MTGRSPKSAQLPRRGGENMKFGFPPRRICALVLANSGRTPTGTATKRAQIKTLLELTGVKAIPRANRQQHHSKLGPRRTATGPGSSPDKGFTIARDAFVSALNAKADAAGGLVDQVTIVYHNAFSATEVADLVKFYQSPLGKKMLSSQSKVNAETFQTAMKWTRRCPPTLNSACDAALKKLALPEPPRRRLRCQRPGQDNRPRKSSNAGVEGALRPFAFAA